MGAIILMILFEDGEGLGAGDTGVVCAFGGLDGFGDFGGWGRGLVI